MTNLPNTDVPKHGFRHIFRHISDFFPKAASFFGHSSFSSFILYIFTTFLSLKAPLHFFQKLLFPDFSIDNSSYDSKSDFDLDDLFGTHRGGDKFIGRYTTDDMEQMIRSSNLNQQLLDLGFKDWYIEIDLTDCFAHFAFLRDRSLPGKDQFIGFIIIQMSEYSFAKCSEFVRKNIPFNLDLLNVKWISLQNPYSQFTTKKPRLPVQKYPGTGLMKVSFSTLIGLARSKGRDGILNFPEHIHNAILYQNFFFIDPAHQGTFRKMVKDLYPDIKKRGLAIVSWAVYFGLLRCGESEVPWEPREMVYPISKKMINYFNSKQYKNASNAAEKSAGFFFINWEKAEQLCLAELVLKE